MAKVIIEIEDDEWDDSVSLAVSFYPDIEDDAKMTRAQNIGVTVASEIHGHLMGGEDDQECTPTD